MFENSKTKVTYITPKDAGIGFRIGTTLFNQETGDAEILIDPDERSEFQQSILAHEEAQLEVVREGWGKYRNGIMSAAHFAGVNAGRKKSQELGVEDEYADYRKLSDADY